MKNLNIKLLTLLMAITITTSGCSVWDSVFRPDHDREHKGEHKGDRDHKGDHDRDKKGDRDHHDR